MKRNKTILPEELISVVVPIYNVEKYLKRCIDSILKQTYKNLDIILVDDGSSDNSGQICDKYKKRYSDIQVIHQENQGLSMARNNGMAVAKGNYITFIDSDDWIKENMIESLISAIYKYGADIAAVSFYNVYDDRKLIKNTKCTDIQVMTKKEALECFLFTEYLTVCVCGKLYKIDIWDGIKCPPGKLFEDQYTTYKLLDKANKVVFIPEPGYYYYKRVDSIGHTEFSKKTYALYYGIQEEYRYISDKYPDLENTIAVAKLTWEIVFINMMLCGKYQEDILLIKNIRAFARKRIIDVYKCKFINIVRKMQISLFAYCFTIYKKLYIEYKKSRSLS